MKTTNWSCVLWFMFKNETRAITYGDDIAAAHGAAILTTTLPAYKILGCQLSNKIIPADSWTKYQRALQVEIERIQSTAVPETPPTTTECINPFTNEKVTLVGQFPEWVGK